MENASKALLIAGSVLIVILLIAMGMEIFGGSQGMVQPVEETMITTEISMFNNKFTPYAGSGKTATQIRSLINLINASNATSDTMVSVSLNGTYYTTLATIRNLINNIEDGKTYQVTLVYDDGMAPHTLEPTKTGCVYRINIIGR